MSLSTLIDSILGKQKKRQEARLTDFRDVVVRIADGHEPDVEHVDAILHDAGKSLDDLRQALAEELLHNTDPSVNTIASSTRMPAHG